MSSHPFVPFLYTALSRVVIIFAGDKTMPLVANRTVIFIVVGSPLFRFQFLLLMSCARHESVWLEDFSPSENVLSPSDDLQSQPQSGRHHDGPFGGVEDWKQLR